jgi:N-acetylglucosaminyldiphosphoundecaprenol N-acetyl-beta-D-mannosaminyltransferase
VAYPKIQKHSTLDARAHSTHETRNFQNGASSDIEADDFSREVFGILGIPIDAVDVKSVICTMRSAVVAAKPFLISTPNLNFLVASQSDPEFRESLLMSDLCPVDGTPIVWIARLLGIPIKRRVAGSDIFEGLKVGHHAVEPSSVFLFGGSPGVVEAAAKVLNSESKGIHCVGHFYPGYGSIDEMSSQSVIDSINASRADFLVASLGAKKGQEWLMKNRHRLRVPVRSHLGATINFQAGTVKRAPLWIRRVGLEWLWRIKEEPYLWRRYRDDGRVFLKLMLTSVLPLVLNTQWRRIKLHGKKESLSIRTTEKSDFFQITLQGAATIEAVTNVTPPFQKALSTRKPVNIDVSGVSVIDARFFGLLLMLRKQLIQQGLTLKFCGLTSRVLRSFRLNRFCFLLDVVQ